MSRYEAFYWVIFHSGINRAQCAIRAFSGNVFCILSNLFEAGRGAMAIPLLFYILALYKRSQVTGHIFGFKVHPGHGLMKLLGFVCMLLFFSSYVKGEIPRDIATFGITWPLTFYGLKELIDSRIEIKIKKDSFEKAFREAFGEKTEADLEAEKRLFKK